jgi:hypothetical protein
MFLPSLLLSHFTVAKCDILIQFWQTLLQTFLRSWIIRTYRDVAVQWNQNIIEL